MFLEIIAMLSTLICVYLTSKRNIWSWPVGIIGIICMFIIYFDEKFYFQTFLQIIFVFQSIYGWISWQKQKNRSNFKVEELNVSIFRIQWSVAVLIGVVLADYMGHYTGSTLPIPDGISTTMSILATYYLAKGYVQAWLVWMSVNVLLFGMTLYQGLYIISGLEVVLLLISINAYIVWKRSLRAGYV